MFLWPLLGSSHSGPKTSPKLRKVAKRTLLYVFKWQSFTKIYTYSKHISGATTSLICSATNISILTILGGNELGWICMSSCVSDVRASFTKIFANLIFELQVVINALVLYWISTPSTSYHKQHNLPRDRYSLPTMDLTALTITAVPQSPVEGRSSVDAKGQQPRSPVQDSFRNMTIPDEMFDYIPKDQLQWRDVDDNDYEGTTDSSPPSSDTAPDTQKDIRVVIHS